MKRIIELILIWLVYHDNNADVSSIYEKITVNGLVSALSLQDGAYLNGTAGNTSDTLSSPFGIAVGTDDSLFISEYRNARVTRLPVNSLIGSVVAGTEIVGNSSSQLNGPSHLYVMQHRIFMSVILQINVQCFGPMLLQQVYQ
jgi:hypothetical protein